MTSTDDHAVHVLNSLIETTLDSANGYRDAAEAADSAEFKSIFTDKAAQRMDLAHRLQQEVRSFGGEPKDDQSMVGKIHNKFTEMKGKMTGSSDKSVIEEVERGEDVIKGKFEDAVSDRDLPAAAQDLIRTTCTSIMADHDQMSRLKHQFH